MSCFRLINQNLDVEGPVGKRKRSQNYFNDDFQANPSGDVTVLNKYKMAAKFALCIIMKSRNFINNIVPVTCSM